MKNLSHTIEVPERRLPAGELAASIIRRRIIQGDIEPGARLTEERLAQELDVSRTAIRDALRRLADEGVVMLVPNRGATVRTVTRKWVVELFEIREVLEGFAARRAAETLVSPDDIRWFRGQLDVWSNPEVIGDGAAFFRENVRFHSGLVSRCGNERLAEFTPKLKTPMPLHLTKFLSQHDEERRKGSAQDHSHIAEAILARDSTGAETVARYHVRRTALLLQSVPDSVFSSS